MVEHENNEFSASRAAPLPSYERYSNYNLPFHEMPVHMLATDPRIPRKVRHRVLLLKLGIPTDRSTMTFPPEVLTSQILGIVGEAQANGWQSVGIGTALLSETGYKFSSPSRRIYFDDSEEDILAKVSSLSYREGTYAPLQDGEYYYVYHNRWDDKENCVGGTIVYLANPNTAESRSDEEYIIELQKGVWPRGIGTHEPGLVQVVKAAHQHSPKTIYFDQTSEQDPVTERARTKLLFFAQDSNVRASIGELMNIIDAKRLRVDFEYFKGVLAPLDFNY